MQKKNKPQIKISIKFHLSSGYNSFYNLNALLTNGKSLIALMRSFSQPISNNFEFRENESDLDFRKLKGIVKF